MSGGGTNYGGRRPSRPRRRRVVFGQTCFIGALEGRPDVERDPAGGEVLGAAAAELGVLFVCRPDSDGREPPAAP